MDPTDAVQPPAQTAAGDAARRRRSHVARRRFTPWAVGVVVAALGAGSLFALSAQASGGRPLRADRADQVALIQEAKARNEEAGRRVRQLEKERDAITRSRAGVNGLAATSQAEADRLAPGAGFAAVRGPALEVVLDDSPRGTPVPADIPADYLVVHQQDVQAVVNALWDGGAEAMMLMDQRVIATSAVRCVGNTLILQGRVYSPPYRIRAIGDPAALQAALDRSPQVSIYKQFVPLVQIGYDVKQLGEQTFPAFEGSPELTFATPLEAGAPATATPSVSPTVEATASGP
jgi:uncharacterized protein YlxW (UPF0749 family)